VSDTPDLPPLPDWVEPLMPRAAEPAKPASDAESQPTEQASASTTVPPLQSIQSSNIAAVGHDGKALYVQFRNGGTYRYQTAGPELHAAMLVDKSAGRYFYQYIKGSHVGIKVTD
jgi:hypothetical protein